MDLPADLTQELLTFDKALADPNRLKIVGLLAQRPCSVEELAALLHVRPPTISHHLSGLAASGLVGSRGQGYYSVSSGNAGPRKASAPDAFPPGLRRGGARLGNGAGSCDAGLHARPLGEDCRSEDVTPIGIRCGILLSIRDQERRGTQVLCR
jgi:DNA-binding transcriptional ArsR family regulator